MDGRIQEGIVNLQQMIISRERVLVEESRTKPSWTMSKAITDSDQSYSRCWSEVSMESGRLPIPTSHHINTEMFTGRSLAPAMQS